MAQAKISLDHVKIPWERLTGESSRGFTAFCLYRDMGLLRSIRKLAKSGDGPFSKDALGRWCKQWKWVERCERYDDYLEKDKRLSKEKEQRQMYDRHTNVALLGMNVAVKGLEALLTKVQQDGSKVNPADLTRLFETCVRVERIARVEAARTNDLRDLIPEGRLGRPQLPINWDIVDALCTVQCTMEEIASALGVSVDTLDNALKRDKKTTFSDYFKEKRRTGFVSLRRKQFQAALNGNVTMMIWLGKQYLNQRDRQEVTRGDDPLQELLNEFQVRNDLIKNVRNGQV